MFLNYDESIMHHPRSDEGLLYDHNYGEFIPVSSLIMLGDDSAANVPIKLDQFEITQDHIFENANLNTPVSPNNDCLFENNILVTCLSFLFL